MKTLKKHNMNNDAEKMKERVLFAKSYNQALCIISEYVNIVSEEDIKTEE